MMAPMRQVIAVVKVNMVDFAPSLTGLEVGVEVGVVPLPLPVAEGVEVIRVEVLL